MLGCALGCADADEANTSDGSGAEDEAGSALLAGGAALLDVGVFGESGESGSFLSSSTSESWPSFSFFGSSSARGRIRRYLGRRRSSKDILE